MDYQRLYSELPKEPIKWTVSDLDVWLSFIGLNSLYPKFKELSIDGSCLNSLTEEDLRDELHIKSGITIKKIMSWINKGLTEYEEYLKQSKDGICLQQLNELTQKPRSGMLVEPNRSSKVISDSTLKPLTLNKMKPPVLSQMRQESQSIAEENEENRIKQYELIIQQYDGPQTSFFSVKEEGAKIGRHSSNSILILDENISRFHAQIKFIEDNFYIKDSGSTTGTFIKIVDKVEIVDEMIIEMGSNQFQAHLEGEKLILEIIEGPLQGTSVEIPKTKVSIGRKQTNLLHFPEDQHLSNVHATFFQIGGRFYVQDMGTTNGTWHRLSFESEVSEPYQLMDKTIFKIGSNQTYCCKIKTAYVSHRPNPNACIICYQNDKDCVYMPCKHNTACIKCSKNLKECPICRVKIEDYVRIYKS